MPLEIVCAGMTRKPAQNQDAAGGSLQIASNLAGSLQTGDNLTKREIYMDTLSLESPLKRIKWHLDSLMSEITTAFGLL